MAPFWPRVAPYFEQRRHSGSAELAERAYRHQRSPAIIAKRHLAEQRERTLSMMQRQSPQHARRGFIALLAFLALSHKTHNRVKSSVVVNGRQLTDSSSTHLR